MSVRWWDHDHGKETRQGLIFHSGELITSSHILYCSSEISLPTLHCCKPIYTWEQAKSAAMWTHIVTYLYVCWSSMLKSFNQFVVRGWENSWLQGMTSIYSIQEELILGLTWTWGKRIPMSRPAEDQTSPSIFLKFCPILDNLWWVMGCWDDGHTSFETNLYLNCNNMRWSYSVGCNT